MPYNVNELMSDETIKSMVKTSYDALEVLRLVSAVVVESDFHGS